MIYRSLGTKEWSTGFYRSFVYENINIVYLEKETSSMLVLDSISQKELYFTKISTRSAVVSFSELADTISKEDFIGSWRSNSQLDPVFFDASEEWIEKYNSPEFLEISEELIFVNKSDWLDTSNWYYIPNINLMVLVEPEKLLNLKSIVKDTLVVERVINHISHEIIYHRVN